MLYKNVIVSGVKINFVVRLDMFYICYKLRDFYIVLINLTNTS